MTSHVDCYNTTYCDFAAGMRGQAAQALAFHVPGAARIKAYYSRVLPVWIDQFCLIMAVLDTAILVGGRLEQIPQKCTALLR